MGWLRRLDGLRQELNLHELKLKLICERRFPAHKKWYYQELKGPLKEALIAARFE